MASVLQKTELVFRLIVNRDMGIATAVKIYSFVLIISVQGIVRCAKSHLIIFIRRNEVLKCLNIQMRISGI